MDEFSVHWWDVSDQQHTELRLVSAQMAVDVVAQLIKGPSNVVMKRLVITKEEIKKEPIFDKQKKLPGFVDQVFLVEGCLGKDEDVAARSVEIVNKVLDEYKIVSGL